IILKEFSVPWVKLTLNKKGAIRGASDVGIIIERGKRPDA
ncbi:MAG TPA: dihydroneopterin aldolase, partial [Methylothermaceae bacterium]|nr:dihydroneopterin aldolase [Methylothermaceae bacterium]